MRGENEMGRRKSQGQRGAGIVRLERKKENMGESSRRIRVEE